MNVILFHRGREVSVGLFLSVAQDGLAYTLLKERG